MREQIKKIVLKAFPELSAGLHLDRYARVLKVSDPPAKGDTCERFRPHYAVDLEILTEDMEKDDQFPVYEAVPLPVTVGCGLEAGMFGFPAPGTLVTVSFAYGRPDHPLVRQVYPMGQSLPEIMQGQQRWQQNGATFQNVDKDGNWSRETDGDITDDSLRRFVHAVESFEEIERELRVINQHSTEEIGGNKVLEVMGALKILSGVGINISAIENINLTSARDLRFVAAQDLQEAIERNRVSKIGGNLQEDVGGDRTSTIKGNSNDGVQGHRTETTKGNHTSSVDGLSKETAKVSKQIEAPFINLLGNTVRIGQAGEGGVSLIPLLIDFMEEVRCALKDAADHIHIHGTDSPSDKQSELAEHSEKVKGQRAKLNSING